MNRFKKHTLLKRYDELKRVSLHRVVAFVASFFCLMSLPLWVGHLERPIVGICIGVVGALVCFLAGLLASKERLRAAGWLLSLMSSAMTLSVITVLGMLESHYSLLVLPVLLASIVLRPMEVWGVAIINFIGMLGVILFYSTKDIFYWIFVSDALFGSVFLLCVTAAFSYISMRYVWDSKMRANEAAMHAMDALETAERALKSRERMIAMLSHDIRTPLTAIIGYSELLYEESEALGLEQFQQDLRSISSSSEHLLSLVGDIIDFAQLDEGFMPVHVERFELDTFVKDVTQTMKVVVEGRGNTFLLDVEEVPQEMWGDRHAIQRVLINVITNASKFTVHGEVTLRLRTCTRAQGVGICFHIVDTGRGMTSEEIERVFNPFEQTKSDASVRREGVGLGLAICHKLCVLMGGGITIKSEVDVGTTMSVWIPLDARAHAVGTYTDVDKLSKVLDVSQKLEHDSRVALVS